MKTFLTLALFLSSNLSHALEIDEKLTLRFLKVSNSKKTILINRGAEDGLVVGDHAKFFITSGVIARGVVEKVSPSRSIWSLYRTVDPTEITDGKVLNLKIASPVKLTNDPSKSMKDEEIPAGTDKMSMDESSQVKSTSDEDKKELEDLGIEDEVAPVHKKEAPKKAEKTKDVSMEESVPVYEEKSSRTWEVFGMAYVNALSGTTEETGTTSEGSTATSASTFDFSGGLEKYFYNTSGFFHEVSLAGFIHKRTTESGTQVKVTSDWLEFGGAGNYHFYNSAASINRLIGHATITGGIGSASVKSTVVSNGTATEYPAVKGSNMFFSLGVGAKYVSSSGIGARAIFDYYVSSEKYDYDGGGSAKRTLSGPRMQFGLSYRF